MCNGHLTEGQTTEDGFNYLGSSATKDSNRTTEVSTGVCTQGPSDVRWTQALVEPT